MAGSREWLRQRLRQAVQGEARPTTLLLLILGVAGVNNAAFILFPGPLYDTRANMLAAVLLLLLMPLARVRGLFVAIVNTMLAVAVGLLVFIAAQTGGINSPALVWLTVLPMPALILVGRGLALGWLGAVMAALGLLFVGSRLGWWGAEVPSSGRAVAWALLNQVTCVLSVVALLRLHDFLRTLQLEQIDQRNHELKAMHAALEQAQAHKEEFVAAVGHELRTPMNAILGLNGVLRDELSDNPDNVELVDHIRRSTQQLLSVVNNILDFSQLQAGELALQPDWIDLPQAIDAAVDTHRDKVRSRTQQLVVHQEPGLPSPVWLDRLRLLQVLGNLLDNAIKFSPDGASLGLRVRTVGDWLRFEVTDCGPGVDPSHVQDLFKGFENPASADLRNVEGTGLGLSICDRLVRLQGGRIGVEPGAAGGSVFWFELPMERPTELDLAHLAQRERLTADTPLAMLLVDDDAVNLMVGRLQLLKAWPKATVTVAASAREAIGLLARQRFDVALLDMIMPEMSGLELARWIRQQVQEDIASLPVLGLTASTHPDDWQRCLDAGMDDVMVKPMDVEQITRVLRRHLRRAKVVPA